MAISERPAQRAPDRQPTAADEPELVARVVHIAAAVAVAAVLVQVTSEFANYFLFDMDVWALNVDADDNAFAWASSVAQFTVAAFCLLLLLAGWWSPWPLLGLTAILAFFSLDDIVRIHEEAASAFRADVLGVETAWGRLVWPIIFLPLLAAAFVLLWRFSERAPALAGRATRIGLVMLVLAVFAEAFSTVFHLGEDQALGSLPDIVEVSIEESLELAAWILIAGALAATVLTSGRRTT